jgi:hypothetical protein
MGWCGTVYRTWSISAPNVMQARGEARGGAIR